MSRKPTPVRKAPPGKDFSEKGQGRKPRADAERNRRLLLDAAKTMFAQKGAVVSLDEIAKSAGVGIGTLYRHFPTREALLQDVYRDESEQLFAAAGRLAAAHPPAEALRKWLRLFVQYFAAKQLVIEALNALVGPDAKLQPPTGASIEEAIGMLVRRVEADGDMRLGMAPLDLLRAIVGLSGGRTEPGWEKSAHRMIDILIAGMRKGDR